MDDFREITGFPGYEVNRRGDVRSVGRKTHNNHGVYDKAPMVLLPKLTGGINLTVAGRRTSYPAWKLVLLAWPDIGAAELTALKEALTAARKARGGGSNAERVERLKAQKREADQRRRAAAGAVARPKRTEAERIEHNRAWQREYRMKRAATRALTEEVTRARSPLTFPIALDLDRMRELVERGVSLVSVAAAFRIEVEQVAEVRQG